MSNETEFETQLAAEIGKWEAALRSGYSVKQMFEGTVNEGPAALASEVKEMLAEVTGGLSMPEALKQWQARHPSQGLNLFVATLLVQRETGGNLADMLQAVGYVLKQKAGN